MEALMSEISVLVVDDDKIICKLLEYNLKNIGYNPIITNSVCKAKEAIEKNIPDLIISDIMMPETNGIEFRKYVKTIPQLQFTPFVFLSARSFENEIVDGFELDVDDYITKPFNITLFNARLKALLKQYSQYKTRYQIDLLTGLLNRFAFDEKLNWELKRLNRYGGKLAVLALDIDKFKLINDNYGHQIGDVALKKLGEIILKSFRNSDFAGRPGGDEMIVVMLETAKDDAYLTSEQFRQKVAAIDIDGIKFTISGGIAVFPNDGTDSKTLLKKADDMLYEAKENGRNRIACKKANHK